MYFHAAMERFGLKHIHVVEWPRVCIIPYLISHKHKLNVDFSPKLAYFQLLFVDPSGHVAQLQQLVPILDF